MLALQGAGLNCNECNESGYSGHVWSAPRRFVRERNLIRSSAKEVEARRDIKRHGEQRNRGTKYILKGLSLKSETGRSRVDNVRWHPDNKEIVIGAAWVPHGDGRTNHNYPICLSLEDVSALVAILGHAGSASDASLLRDHLGKQVPALIKLLACATGLVPTPMAEIKPPVNKST